MKIYNRYILLLVSAMSFTDVIMIFAGLDDLSIYFTINVVVFLLLTLLHAYFNPGTRRTLSIISLVLFVAFMVNVVVRAVEFLARR